MIIADFNKMTLEELDIINYHLGIEMEINDGKITNAAGNSEEE